MSILYKLGPVFLSFPSSTLLLLLFVTFSKKQPSSWHRPTAVSRYHHTFFSNTLAGMKENHYTHHSQSPLHLKTEKRSSRFPEQKSATLASLQPPDNPCKPIHPFFFLSKKKKRHLSLFKNIPSIQTRSKFHHPCTLISKKKNLAWQHVAKSQLSQTPQKLVWS